MISEQNQQQDQYCMKAFEAMNHGDYEEAFNNFKQTESLPPHKKESYLRECLHLITDQYVYLIQESMAEGKTSEAKALKQEYADKFGGNPKIDKIVINATSSREYKYNPQKTSHNLVITPDVGNSFWKNKTSLLLLTGAIVAVIIVIFIFYYLRVTHLELQSDTDIHNKVDAPIPEAYVYEPTAISPTVFNDSLHTVLKKNNVKYNIVSYKTTEFEYKGREYKVEVEEINNAELIDVNYSVELGSYKADLRNQYQIPNAINRANRDQSLVKLLYSEMLYGDVAAFDEYADFDDVLWYEVSGMVGQTISSPANLSENIIYSINELIRVTTSFADRFADCYMDN